MINFGPVPVGSVLPIPFTSYGANGASITMTGFSAGDAKVYKGTSMTQRSSASGYVLMDTDGTDIDGVTGLHGISIDTGDDTDAGFYSVGSFFWVLVNSVTVDGLTIIFLAATFRLVPAETVAGVPKTDVAALNGVAASAANLEKSASVIYRGSVTGAATTTTLVDSGLTQSDTDHWKGRVVIFTSGALAGQATDITGFTPGTDTLTFSTLSSAPSGSDTYVIV